MSLYYAAATMGFDGKGYGWHKWFNFPSLPIVTKTVTLNPIHRRFRPIVHLGNSVWNHIGLHNPGLDFWLKHCYNKSLILSIAGTDEEIDKMLYKLKDYPLAGIELNFSCPNTVSFDNTRIPDTPRTTFLKLNCYQSPMDYDGIESVRHVSLNSVPGFGGGISGRLARKKNWKWIKKYAAKVSVVGNSFSSTIDMCKLMEMGVKDFAIGSVILTKPWFVEQL